MLEVVHKPFRSTEEEDNVGLFSKEIETMDDLLPRGLQDIYTRRRSEHCGARYGTLIAWAEELGHEDIVRFLTANLNEEKAANSKLNTVALRKGVNRKAAS